MRCYGAIYHHHHSMGIRDILYYCITSPMRHRPTRWITPLKHKNASLIRHHAPSSNACTCLRIGTVKAGYFRNVFVQSPQPNTYLTRRYSLKCWPVRFTYKAPSLIRPVPYKWGITVRKKIASLGNKDDRKISYWFIIAFQQPTYTSTE